ncbi:hypothetical protein [Aquimarina algiphila]|uniref:Uncharacterized protein n=1 Tax=Aquimarina algiphila TaxID=2047982 RepID=A0A554VE46_9FLAO|nr:hypothetical protein [Aquimarina algiphila]TSE05254.1 hypothetical protein FOF46_23615 [Aquimarina algiphila]
MLDCSELCGKIVAEQVIDCNSIIVKGIEQAVLLINRCDIDNYSVVKSDTEHKATAINLKPGTTGYLIKGLNGKSLFNASHSINVNDDAPDDWNHTVALRGWNLTEANLVYIRNLGRGADLVAITLDKTASDDLNKYKVYGLENGLKIGEYSQNTGENKGAFIYTLASKAPDFETDPPVVWLEADLPATDAKYLNKLAVAVTP